MSVLIDLRFGEGGFILEAYLRYANYIDATANCVDQFLSWVDFYSDWLDEHVIAFPWE